MKKSLQRVLSVLLALMLCVSLLPAAALADGEDSPQEADAEAAAVMETEETAEAEEPAEEVIEADPAEEPAAEEPAEESAAEEPAAEEPAVEEPAAEESAAEESAAEEPAEEEPAEEVPTEEIAEEEPAAADEEDAEEEVSHGFATEEELRTLIDTLTEEDGRWALYEGEGPFVFDADIELPSDFEVSIHADAVIAEGAEVTSRGRLGVIGSMTVQGRLFNYGNTSSDGLSGIGNVEVYDDTIGYWIGHQVNSESELRSVIAEGESLPDKFTSRAMTFAPIELTADLTVNEHSDICLKQPLTIPAEFILTGDGCVHLDSAALLVYGTFINNAWMNIDAAAGGRLVLEDGGSYGGEGSFRIEGDFGEGEPFAMEYILDGLDLSNYAFYPFDAWEGWGYNVNWIGAADRSDRFADMDELNERIQEYLDNGWDSLELWYDGTEVAPDGEEREFFTFGNIEIPEGVIVHVPDAAIPAGVTVKLCGELTADAFTVSGVLDVAPRGRACVTGLSVGGEVITEYNESDGARGAVEVNIEVDSEADLYLAEDIAAGLRDDITTNDGITVYAKVVDYVEVGSFNISWPMQMEISSLGHWEDGAYIMDSCGYLMIRDGATVTAVESGISVGQGGMLQICGALLLGGSLSAAPGGEIIVDQGGLLRNGFQDENGEFFSGYIRLETWNNGVDDNGGGLLDIGGTFENNCSVGVDEGWVYGEVEADNYQYHGALRLHGDGEYTGFGNIEFYETEAYSVDDLAEYMQGFESVEGLICEYDPNEYIPLTRFYIQDRSHCFATPEELAQRITEIQESGDDDRWLEYDGEGDSFTFDSVTIPEGFEVRVPNAVIPEGVEVIAEGRLGANDVSLNGSLTVGDEFWADALDVSGTLTVRPFGRVHVNALTASGTVVTEYDEDVGCCGEVNVNREVYTIEELRAAEAEARAYDDEAYDGVNINVHANVVDSIELDGDLNVRGHFSMELQTHYEWNEEQGDVPVSWGFVTVPEGVTVVNESHIGIETGAGLLVAGRLENHNVVDVCPDASFLVDGTLVNYGHIGLQVSGYWNDMGECIAQPAMLDISGVLENYGYVGVDEWEVCDEDGTLLDEFHGVLALVSGGSYTGNGQIEFYQTEAHSAGELGEYFHGFENVEGLICEYDPNENGPLTRFYIADRAHSFADTAELLERIADLTEEEGLWADYDGQDAFTFDDVTIPRDFNVNIPADAVIPAGVTVTVNGGFNVDGTLTVEEGGTLILHNGIGVGGLSAQGDMVFEQQDEWTGGFCEFRQTVRSESELRDAAVYAQTALPDGGNYGVRAIIVRDIVLTGDFAAPENLNVEIGHEWIDGAPIVGSLTVPAGMTLTLNGFDGNCGSLTVRGTLLNRQWMNVNAWRGVGDDDSDPNGRFSLVFDGGEYRGGGNINVRVGESGKELADVISGLALDDSDLFTVEEYDNRDGWSVWMNLPDTGLSLRPARDENGEELWWFRAENIGDDVTVAAELSVNEGVAVTTHWYEVFTELREDGEGRDPIGRREITPGNMLSMDVSTLGDNTITVENVTGLRTFELEAEDEYGNEARVGWFWVTVDNGLDLRATDDQWTVYADEDGCASLSVTADAKDTDGLRYFWYTQDPEQVNEWGDPVNIWFEGKDAPYMRAEGVTSAVQYGCKVIDKYGNDAWAWITVSVDNHLRVDSVDGRSEVYVPEGEAYTLQVRVEQDLVDGPLSFEWWRATGTGHGPEEDGGENLSCDADSLEIVGEGGEAIYVCRVIDAYGNMADYWFFVTPEKPEGYDNKFSSLEELLEIIDAVEADDDPEARYEYEYIGPADFTMEDDITIPGALNIMFWREGTVVTIPEGVTVENHGGIEIGGAVDLVVEGAMENHGTVGVHVNADWRDNEPCAARPGVLRINGSLVNDGVIAVHDWVWYGENDEPVLDENGNYAVQYHGVLAVSDGGSFTVPADAENGAIFFSMTEITIEDLLEEGWLQGFDDFCLHAFTEWNEAGPFTVVNVLAAEHDWDDGAVTTPATCTEDGMMTYTCRNDADHIRTEVIPAKGHTPIKVEAKPATTEAKGNIEYYVCDVCGRRFADENCTEELTAEQTEIPMLVPTIVEGWRQNARGWWYQNADGSYPANAWKAIGGKWYHFDASGYMQTGWLNLGVWYYFSDSGAMVTGWQKISNVWYWFADSGAMVTNWQKIGSTWYYFSASGAMQTGWQKIGDVWYYFQASGAMQTGWAKIGSAWYYFSGSGAMITGWQQIGNVWYFFLPSGAMAANEWYGGYWFGASGAWTYQPRGSWKGNDTSGWWFGDTSGWYAKNETLKIDSNWYTFNAAGYWVK